MATYMVRRFYFEEHPPRTIKRGLTLEQAEAHCKDPETSSRTATTSEARERTERLGPWFDGYEQEKS